MRDIDETFNKILARSLRQGEKTSYVHRLTTGIKVISGEEERIKNQFDKRKATEERNNNWRTAIFQEPLRCSVHHTEGYFILIQCNANLCAPRGRGLPRLYIFVLVGGTRACLFLFFPHDNFKVRLNVCFIKVRRSGFYFFIIFPS